RLPAAPTTARVKALLAPFNTLTSETVALVGAQPVPAISVQPSQVPADLVALVRRGNLAFERLDVNDTPYLVMGAPVSGHRTTLLFLFVSEQRLFADLSSLGVILLVGWGVVVVLAGLVGSVLARRTLAPVARASDAARSLAEGLLETRLPVGSNDEFGAWASSFNEMAQALESKIEALQAAHQRERRFTSDVSHELRTPVTALVNEASLLREHLDRIPEDARRPAELLVHDVARLRRLVEDLMEISRLDSGAAAVRVEPVDLPVLVNGIIRARGWDSGVEVSVDPVVIQTDRRRLERILANLIANAVEHGTAGVMVRTRGDGDDLRIDVSDRGPGIRPEDRGHLFDRFYKADPSRSSRGSGLGLAIAQENAHLLGGGIDVTSEPGAGATFSLRLPVTQRLRPGERRVSSRPHDEATTEAKGGEP
ncbi:MAG TPA: HAMP domain-containing sensor histidine kinase, partial [Actinomycetota bacterium]|nr:HAMP domain-containing sensor histidine kinase [Actinomycetota bacterium]